MTLQYLKTLDPGSKAYRDDRYTDGIYLALKRLSVVVKQPMDFQSIVVEFYTEISHLCSLSVLRLKKYSFIQAARFPVSGLHGFAAA